MVGSLSISILLRKQLARRELGTFPGFTPTGLRSVTSFFMKFWIQTPTKRL